jgi:hypothetical protein
MSARWWGEKLWTLIPTAAITGQFLETFKKYPPSQPTMTLGVTEFLQAIQSGAAGAGQIANASQTRP